MITTVILAIAFILTFVGGFVVGVTGLLGYMIWRLMSNLEWDDSNMTNALRIVSHIVLHPNDFFRLYYMTDEELRVFVEIFGREPDRPTGTSFTTNYRKSSSPGQGRITHNGQATLNQTVPCTSRKDARYPYGPVSQKREAERRACKANRLLRQPVRQRCEACQLLGGQTCSVIEDMLY